jgi:opacity protein-like surface antigen
MTVRPPIRSLFAVIVLLLGAWATARAQVSFDISPYASLYAPLGSMFVPGNCGGSPCGYANGGSPVPLGQTVALQKTIALGGHLTAWPTGRSWGIEATVAYAPSGVTMACRVPDCNAGHAVTASARVVVPVIGVTSARSFYLGAGVGLVALGGTAYKGVAGTTSISPTVGAGVELKVASARSVRIEAEDYFFRPSFRFESCDASDGVCRVLPPNTGWTQQFQHTLILSVGWVFRGGGPR